MKSVPLTTARSHMKDVVNRVSYGHERIYLTAHDQKVAVLISVEDAELLEYLEDQYDIELAKKSLKDIKKHGTVSFDDVMDRLGFDV